MLLDLARYHTVISKVGCLFSRGQVSGGLAIILTAVGFFQVLANPGLFCITTRPQKVFLVEMTSDVRLTFPTRTPIVPFRFHSICSLMYHTARRGPCGWPANPVRQDSDVIYQLSLPSLAASFDFWTFVSPGRAFTNHVPIPREWLCH